MATTLQTSIRINAPVSKVWDILTDTESYPSWNPFIKEIKGTLRKGERLNVMITDMKFTPTVTEWKENQIFEWLGHLWIPRVFFDGRHRFELVEEADGTTTFLHGEQFSGILVPFLQKMINVQTKENFEKMNVALKERVEG